MIAGEQYLATIFLFGNYAIAITHTSMHTCLHKYRFYYYIANLEYNFWKLKLFLTLIILSAPLLLEFRFHTLLPPL